MSDYLNLLKEYDEINSNCEAIRKDFNFFESYIKQFISSISSIDKCIINSEKIKENSLIFFVEKYKELFEKIKTIVNIDDITSPLYSICENQNNQMKKILTSYKKIKNDLFEGKLKLNNAKKEYIEIFKKDNETKEQNNESEKNEDNLLFDTKKNSSFTVYKYQLEKLNEKIDESNIKYNEIIPELDSINLLRESTYKIIILKFAKIVGNIGKLFLNFKDALEEKFLKPLNEKSSSNKYCLNENENGEINKKERFKKEQLITPESINLINKENVNKDNNKNAQEEKPNNDNNNENTINNEKIKVKPSKSIEGLDF